MTDKRFRSTMVEYGWIRFQAKRQQQLELVVASWVIRKGGVRSGQKIMDLMCEIRRIPTQPWKLRISKSGAGASFCGHGCRARCAAGVHFGTSGPLWCFGLVLCRVVGVVGTSMTNKDCCKQTETNGFRIHGWWWMHVNAAKIFIVPTCESPHFCLFVSLCSTQRQLTNVSRSLSFHKKSREVRVFFKFWENYCVKLCGIPEEQDALLCEDEEFVESKILRAQRFKRSFVFSLLLFFFFRRGEDRHGRAWNVVDDYLGKPCQMGCSIWNVCERYEIYHIGA